MLRVTRVKGIQDMFRSYKVVVDHRTVGSLKPGEHVDVDLTPGEHEIRMEIDWCSSRTVQIVEDGSLREFETGCSIRGIRYLYALAYVTFLRHDYLWLKETGT